jgi:hypothetical protein
MPPDNGHESKFKHARTLPDAGLPRLLMRIIPENIVGTNALRKGVANSMPFSGHEAQHKKPALHHRMGRLA